MEDSPQRSASHRGTSSSAPGSSASSRSASSRSASSATITRKQYWRKQLKRIFILLAVWFIAGYVMSIFFVESLNSISLGGMPFGFWMAQQGSIFVFISLILIYAISAGRLDRRAGVHETAGTTKPPSKSADH